MSNLIPFSCKTCLYWKDKRYCDYVNIQDGGNKQFFIDVYVLDDSGLEVTLLTGPDFGCCHFFDVGYNKLEQENI